MFGLIYKSFKKDYKETSLRGLFALIFVATIIGISMNKILVAFGVKTAEPLISLQIKHLEQIPVWPSFICGQGFTGVTAQTLKRGQPGTLSDVATDLPQSYIQRLTTNSLTTGDWTAQSGSWPCFIFNPPSNMVFKPGVIDQIILLGLVNQPVNTPTGLLYGIFDEERNLSSVEPFVSPLPSVNTFTFTRNERLDVSNKPHSYFFVNKQNTIPMPFENPNLAARFAYSPDSYLVLRYTEKQAYTPYDLISAIGGLTTYALAVWFVLFGRGKYRSWGLVQRYLLRSSPDARKKDDSNLLPISYEKSRETESQLNNSTLIGSPASKTLSNPDSDERPPSIFYFTTSGTPTQSRFTNNSLSPPYYNNNNNGKDLNKRIDAKINQKLWFVEQTLSRHYLKGFKLRRYDVDLKKLGLDTSYDVDDKEEASEALTPPHAHHNWNNFNSGVRRNSDQNSHKSIQIHSSFNNDNGSQHSEKNNNSTNSSNPEERRSQYPNVSIGQVPLEKKQRGRNSGSGSGNYQQFANSAAATGIAPSSYYYPQISQSDNVNSNLTNPTTSSQSQIPPSLQVQGPPQGSPQILPQNPSQNPQGPPQNPQGAPQGAPQIPPSLQVQGPPQGSPQIPPQGRQEKRW